MIAACGNNCSVCPRYAVDKSNEELRKTAELWFKIGYRNRVVSEEDIACFGCNPKNWCRYNVVLCCDTKDINNCSECEDFPCNNMKKCFKITKSFEPKCKEVCTQEEYQQIKTAFFEKEKNLKSLQNKTSNQ